MFFKNDRNKDENSFLINTCALLIHAAKIDENYTENEEEIIKKTLLELGATKENIIQTIQEAKKIENTATTSACKEPKNNGRSNLSINFPMNIM